MPWMSVVVLEVVVVLSSFVFFTLLGRGTAAILLVTALFVLLRKSYPILKFIILLI
jgi:hypothetical protein